ncbi:MAG: ATP synthase F1 subunit gamma [Myxococcota bacterium]
MATLRDIRTRIASVKNTRQITNAMKMVSAAKLRRATESATSARPYQQTLTLTLRRVAAGAGEVEHPLLTSRDVVKKVLVIVVTSDRGLCGGFNGTLNRRTEDFIKKQRAAGHDVAMRTYGRKSKDYFKNRGFANAISRTDLVRAQFADEAATLAGELTAEFEAGGFDEAWIAFNQFKSVLAQVPTFNRVLPLSIETGDASAEAGGADYVYEPSGESLLGALLPMYLRTLLLQAFLETEAGEQAARMTAMDNATRNASDLISALTLEYNRGRQAAITKELIEIVSGAEAL